VSQTDALLDTFFSVDLWLVFIAFSLNIVGLFLKTIRWWLVVRVSNVEIGLQRLFGTYLVGTFFAQFMPGSAMGGDAMRMMEMGADSGRMMVSVSSVLLERVIGLITIFVSASAILIIAPNEEISTSLRLVVHGMAGAGLIGLVILRLGWFMPTIVRVLTRIRLGKVAVKMQTLSRSLQGHLGQGRMLAQMVLLSFLTNACTMTASYIALSSVGEQVNYFAFIPLIALAVTIEIIPISPGSLGVREATYVAFLTGFLGVPESASLTTALIVRAIGFAQGIMGGFILIARAFDSRARRSTAQSTTITQ
jgi:uncharacterized protein (TIRG00374 family)